MSNEDPDNETFAEWQIQVRRRIRDVLIEHDCAVCNYADEAPPYVILQCLGAYLEEQDLFTFLTDAIGHKEKDIRRMLADVLRIDRSPHDLTGEIAREGLSLIKPLIDEALNPFHEVAPDHQARVADQARRVADLKAETQ